MKGRTTTAKKYVPAFYSFSRLFVHLTLSLLLVVSFKIKLIESQDNVFQNIDLNALIRNRFNLTGGEKLPPEVEAYIRSQGGAGVGPAPSTGGSGTNGGSGTQTQTPGGAGIGTNPQIPPPPVQPQEGGLLNSLFNSFQLGLKNVVDQVVPNVQIPNVLPPSVPDVHLGDIKLPSFLGSGRLIPSGCPVCQNLHPDYLEGKTWHMVYANDNFVKSRLAVVSKVSESFTPSGGGGLRFPKPGGIAFTIQDMFNPVRSPTCVKLQIGKPISYGFLMDFPMILSLKEGKPSSPLRALPGNFRQVDQGKYLMMFGGGAYVLRFCAVDSNFISLFYPPKEAPNVFNQAGGSGGDVSSFLNLGNLESLAALAGLGPGPQGSSFQKQNFHNQNSPQRKKTAADLFSQTILRHQPSSHNSNRANRRNQSPTPEYKTEYQNTGFGTQSAGRFDQHPAKYSDRYMRQRGLLQRHRIGRRRQKRQKRQIQTTTLRTPVLNRLITGSPIINEKREITGKRAQPFPTPAPFVPPNPNRHGTTTTITPGATHNTGITFPAPTAPPGAAVHTPPPPPPAPEEDFPLYMVLSDTGGFPACQNYAVFTDNPEGFFKTYDAHVTNFVARNGADGDANPLQYLGCPPA